MFFFSSHITPNIAYLPTQLFNHSRFQFRNPPPPPPVPHPDDLLNFPNIPILLKLYMYIPFLTKYCRRESRVGVAPPPLSLSNFQNMHHGKQHYQILGIIMGGGVVFVYFKTFLARLARQYMVLLNDLEFPPILLVSDWPRRHLLECTSE